jgi:glycine/sarcosine N-methyltransferase
MTDDVTSFYDQLAVNYHLIFEDWNASIIRQGAILGAILERECGPATRMRILDCACGVGTQLLGLAARGFRISGCDLSPRAVQRARLEAGKRGLDVQVLTANMMDLNVVTEHDFDAVICMDNALPHLDNDDNLLQALTRIRGKLGTGKLFMASIRDYDALIQERPLVPEPALYCDHGKRRIVHQLWDWSDSRRYTFHLYITREVEHGWENQHYVSRYRAVLREELSSILETAGFMNCRWVTPAESGFYQPIVLATAK